MLVARTLRSLRSQFNEGLLRGPSIPPSLLLHRADTLPVCPHRTPCGLTRCPSLQPPNPPILLRLTTIDTMSEPTLAEPTATTQAAESGRSRRTRLSKAVAIY